MTPSSGCVSSGGHTRWFRAFSRTHLVCAISGANMMTSLLSLLHVAVVLQPYVMMTLFLASGTASSNLDREQQVFQPFSLQSAIRSVFSGSSGGPGRSFFSLGTVRSVMYSSAKAIVFACLDNSAMHVLTPRFLVIFNQKVGRI